MYLSSSVFNQNLQLLLTRQLVSSFQSTVRTYSYRKNMAAVGQGRPSLTTPDSEDTNREKCLFCRIADERSQDLTSLIYKDDEIVVFPDIRPAAKYHYLIVPREHIRNAKVLTAGHARLADRLVEIGQRIVNEKIVGDALAEGSEVNVQDVPKLLGYHWPPFHSIAHLHLHVIAPTTGMGFISRTIFRPNSWWFVTPEYVKERLSQDVMLPCDSQGNNSKSDGSPKC